MKTRTLAIAALVGGCASPGHRPDSATGPSLERALGACKKMVASTAETPAAGPPQGDEVPDFQLSQDRELTIRVLRTDPFMFLFVDPGTRTSGGWSSRGIWTAEADPALLALPFGAVVRVHYIPHLDMNSSPPPSITADPPGGPVPAADAALLADWLPARQKPSASLDVVWSSASYHTQVQVYADSHAVVTAPPNHFWGPM